MLSANSPSQRSESDETAEAKTSEDAQGFDGTLVASMMPGAQTPAQQRNSDAAAIPLTEAANAATNPQAGETIANATRQAGAATKGVEFPDVKRLLDTKSNQSVNGTMTDVFVAGPNTPWKSDWVFGADKPNQATNSEKLQGIAQALAKLQTATQTASVSGGDESQLSQIQSALAGLDGELTIVEADVAKGQTKPQLLSGAEYLNALQGAQSQAGGSELGGQGAGAFGSNQQSGLWAQQAAAAQTKGVKANQAGLQLVPGGVSAGGSRLEKIEKSKDTSAAPELTLGVNPQNLMQANKTQAVPIPTMTANVVPGSMMKDRMTSDSVLNVSSGISKLEAQGGGEMRIRLNPDHLGELTIHVATNGQDVGLKVQASSGGAKKILEESMNSLRESLATQNLMLGRVDVAVMPSGTNTDMNGQSNSGQQNWSQNQNGSMDLSGNSAQGREGNSRWDRDSGASPESRIARANVSSSTFGPSRSRAAGASSSRLDVMA